VDKLFLAGFACAAQSFAVDGHHLSGSELGNGRNPVGKALLHFVRIKCRKDPVEGVVRWNAAGQSQKRLQPLPLILAVQSNVVPTLGPAQHRCDGNQKNLFQ
jgi:hypothetical protein